jgi:hypothetical protein
MLNIGSGGQSWLVGYAGLPLRVDVPCVQAMPLLGPPSQTPEPARLQTGHGWMPGMVSVGSVAVSPTRKSSDWSGKLRLVAPVLQITDPVGAPPMKLIVQTLVGVLAGFGIASGPPKRHPVDVQVRLLPVWVEVVPPIVAVWPEQVVIEVIEVARSGIANGNGTELPPPPV